jgi:putative membrane protein insertion efficiency factor
LSLFLSFKLLVKLLETLKKIEVNGDTFELNVDPKDAIIIERYFSKYTQRDLQIKSQPIPKNPLWLNLVVRLIRFYQLNISPKLGNRCVFDPSCSCYAEQTYRKKGFFRGSHLTIKRLHRCKPQNGGIDKLG